MSTFLFTFFLVLHALTTSYGQLRWAREKPTFDDFNNEVSMNSQPERNLNIGANENDGKERNLGESRFAKFLNLARYEEQYPTMMRNYLEKTMKNYLLGQEIVKKPSINT